MVQSTSDRDSVSIDASISYGQGAFKLTGLAASASQISSVDISASVDGVVTDLGDAKVAADGSFSLVDEIGAHQQGFFVATVTDTAGGTASSADPAFSLTGGLAGNGAYQARQTRYRPDGMAETAEALFKQDGAQQVDLLAPGQTFTSSQDEVFENEGQPKSTFIFDPNHGRSRIDLFRVDGSDHDVLSFEASDFDGSIDNVLKHARNTTGGVVIRDPVTGDVVRLAGITKAQLRDNQDDIVLRASDSGSAVSYAPAAAVAPGGTAVEAAAVTSPEGGDSFALAGTGQYGTATVDSATGAVTYKASGARPAAGTLGTDDFTVTDTDRLGVQSTATAAFAVDGGPAIAYAPVSVASTQPITDGPTQDVSPATGNTFAFVDPTTGETVETETGQYGTATIDAISGVITYTASGNAKGTDSFKVSDTDLLGVAGIASAVIDVATPVTWTGRTSDDWTDASNWNGGVPTSDESVSIPANTPNDPSVTAGQTVVADNLSISNQGTIAVGPDVTASTLDLTGDTAIDGGSLTIGPAAMLEGAGTISSAIANAGTITATGGTLDLAGTLSGDGTLEIAAGATLELASGDTQPTGFDAGTGTLKLDAGGTFTSTITSFTGTGDAIDLANIGEMGEIATWMQGANGSGTLMLSHNGTVDATLNLNGSYTTADFHLQSDGGSGTVVTLIDRWIVGANGNWNTAADWTLGVVPSASANAAIEAAGTYTVTVNDAEQASTLTLDAAGATLVDGAGGALVIGGALTVAAGTVDLTGGTLTAGTTDIAAGANLEGVGSLSMPIANAGMITATGGTLDLTGALTGAGSLKVGGGATLELAGAGEGVSFATRQGTLRLDAPASFTSTIAGVQGTQDYIDLIGFNVSGASGAMPTTATTGAGSYNVNTGITTLTVSDPSLQKSETFALVGNYSTSTWSITSDGHGGIDIVDPPAGAAAGDAASSALDGDASHPAFVFDPGRETDAFHSYQLDPARQNSAFGSDDASRLAKVLLDTGDTAQGTFIADPTSGGTTPLTTSIKAKSTQHESETLFHP